jgi:hypothetical protein
VTKVEQSVSSEQGPPATPDPVSDGATTLNDSSTRRSGWRRGGGEPPTDSGRVREISRRNRGDRTCRRKASLKTAGVRSGPVRPNRDKRNVIRGRVAACTCTFVPPGISLAHTTLTHNRDVSVQFSSSRKRYGEGSLIQVTRRGRNLPFLF